MKDNTRLKSGRVTVKQPSQVSADRYQFLDLASAEPNLGTASTNSVLTTNTVGQRIWSANLSISNADISSTLTADRIYSDNIYFANGQPYISATVDSNIYNGTFTATSTLTLIDSVPLAGTRSVKWIVSAKDNSNNHYKSSSIDALTDESSVYYNEYGIVLSSSAEVASFSVAILGSNINLYAVGDSEDVVINYQRTTLGSSTMQGHLVGAGYIQNSVGSGTATNCIVDPYTGNGSQVNFGLSVTPANKDQTVISIGGVMQPKSTYSLSGSTITFSSAPASGVPIEVISFITTTVTGYTGSVGATGPAGFSPTVLTGTTSNAVETEIFVGGVTNSRLSITNNKAVLYELVILARRTDVSGDAAAWHIKTLAQKISGTASDVGGLYEVVIGSTDPSVSVDVRTDVVNGTLGVYVTGSAGKTYSWKASATAVEV